MSVFSRVQSFYQQLGFVPKCLECFNFLIQWFGASNYKNSNFASS